MLGRFSLNYLVFGKAKHLTGFRMSFNTLRQFANFILLSLRGILFLSRPKTNIYVSVKKTINKELFESVL